MDRRGLQGELQRAQCEPDRMAGAGRWAAAARGRGGRPGIARSGSQCRAHLELDRGTEGRHPARGTLAHLVKQALIFVAALIVATVAAAGEKVVSSRVWPAEEYTRVTLESARPLRHQ